MIIIPIRKTPERRIQITISENPTPGSWGSHQLLLYEYRGLEEDDQWDQMIFNYKFLKDKQIDYGPLWCVYCGKEELVIYHWRERSYFYNMATVDHFYPRSLHPHLSKVKSNLRVACYKCNSKKGVKIWQEKFPYD